MSDACPLLPCGTGGATAIRVLRFRVASTLGVISIWSAVFILVFASVMWALRQTLCPGLERKRYLSPNTRRVPLPDPEANPLFAGYLRRPSRAARRCEISTSRLFVPCDGEISVGDVPRLTRGMFTVLHLTVPIGAARFSHGRQPGCCPPSRFSPVFLRTPVSNRGPAQPCPSVDGHSSR